MFSTNNITMKLTTLLCVGYLMTESHAWTHTYVYNDGSNVLDMTCMQTLTFNQFDGSQYNYVYTPCRNGLQFRTINSTYNITGMVLQIVGSNIKFLLAKWDQSGQAQYDSTSNHWDIKFNNGDVDCFGGTTPRYFTLRLVCNHSTTAMFHSVIETEICHYIMTINTKYACLGTMCITDSPTTTPTSAPTQKPTKAPTNNPTNSPTLAPSNSPLNNPTIAPTNSPLDNPTNSPTLAPSNSPLNNPTIAPTNSPLDNPTNSPTLAPTNSPTNPPLDNPTIAPTLAPTLAPSNSPLNNPTIAPTNSPLDNPTNSPT
eukprot:168644_1